MWLGEALGIVFGEAANLHKAVPGSLHQQFRSGERVELGTAKPGSGDDHFITMIRKLESGEYRLYSRKKNPKTGRRKNLGTFSSRAAAEKHERVVQYFKRA
jgi:hypothetical protein